MKNAYVELCRFLGAIIILCHHTYIFGDRVYFLPVGYLLNFILC